MNLAYHLKLHHTRNMYLRAWLHTCANMNIMPASIYQLVFKDPEMKKIKPCKMQISTYTADTVKIIGSCIFDVVHPDTKKLVPVTFYVANNNGSMLLSCKTTLALQFIQPWSRLDYLPPWASLSQALWTTLRKQSWHLWRSTDQNKKCLLKGMNHQAKYKHLYLWIQSKNWIQALQLLAKNKYYQNIQMYLKVSADFPICHTTYRSI